MISSFIEWASKKVYIPRLWTKEEWEKLSAKEKMWIWYKHHDYLIGAGNGELDKILPFLTGEFLTTAGVMVAVFTLLGFPEWSYAIYPVFYIIYKYVQWFVGDQIDKRDLIAVSSEIGNKRQIAFRELREKAKEEDWRKAKVN